MATEQRPGQGEIYRVTAIDLRQFNAVFAMLQRRLERQDLELASLRKQVQALQRTP